MKKIRLKLLFCIVAAVGAHQVALATQVLECGFTEPFYTLYIDVGSHTITKEAIQNDDGKASKTILYKDIKLITDFSDPFYPKYAIHSQDNKVIASLKLNNKGSDLMSDNIYPFQIHFNGSEGGCWTQSLPAIEVQIEKES